jgi:hypothetical protein
MPVEYGNHEAVRRYYARLAKSGVIAKLLSHFPKTTSIHNPGGGLAHQQLACLQNLLERRPRGRAALERQAEADSNLSLFGDKLESVAAHNSRAGGD